MLLLSVLTINSCPRQSFPGIQLLAENRLQFSSCDFEICTIDALSFPI